LELAGRRGLALQRIAGKLKVLIHRKIRWLSLGVFIGALAFAATPVQAPKPASGQAMPIKVALRRITETQYRHTIADVFGPTIKINARFEPEKRVDRLLAIGSAQLSLTSSGFEQYFILASSISDQVLGERQRTASVPCKPADPTRADDACARLFIERYGERLFRRPLTKSETVARLRTASTGARQSGDFYAGLKLALTSLLVAPEFLFRVETAEPDPAHPQQYRLDGYTKAARLSFLLWDSAPDQELLAAARSGAIHTEAGLKQQLNRMIESPRFEDGVRAFFTDMLELDGIENLVKDPAIYPKFNQSVSDSAKEQTLKTAIDLLVRKRRDYRDLFTSNDTFINRPLASVYRIPLASSGDWAPYTFPQSSERSGILTQVSFLSLFAHPGTSSPTKRGIKVYEIFMCQGTPDPPADVDFSRVQDSSKGTVRARLLDHMQNTGCAVCHRRTDPPGLALEHFDGLGQLRTMENGTAIDVSAGINGVKFEGAQGLGQFLHDDPRVPGCLVRNVYAYGAGREIDDEDYLVDQTKAFAGSGYRFPDLIEQIASSRDFFKVVVPSGAERTSSTAAAETAPLKTSKGVVP
jgi:Protein of unknown function (DUF1592)/Protein of unknown function (DUF1588)/Protein of unknown function (DUF1595)/Protein of unknown function (DUF1585)/Protein of unknown function (DUF1587)